MRKVVFLALVLAASLAAAAGAQTFVGVLNGANEFPGPGDADGFGLAGFRFEGTTVTYNIMIQHLNPTTASHIHRGAAGVAGPVVITLASTFPFNFASGSATASTALIDEIRRNPSGFYVNIHTGDFPDGAIRSQLSSGSFAVATGANEFPGPGDPDGLGMAVFNLSGTTLTYNAVVQNIAAPNASHIHRGAVGVAGPVVVTLAGSFPGDRATGTATITQPLLEEVLGNPTGFYFNVHNAAYPDGAIRGQLAIQPYSEVYYFPVVGHADGANNTRFVADVRAVNSGTAPATLTLEYFASSSAGLSAPSVTRGAIVAPGQELVVNDVVSSQFSTTGLGALKLGVSDPMTTGVRVFNDLRPTDGGTTGFFIRPKGISEAATSGTLLFLSQASAADLPAGLGFRTNIGCFNPNLVATPATFTAHRASDGLVLGSVNVVIPALLQVQDPAFQLISTVAAGDQTQTDFYVTWTSTLPIYIYGAVVDNKTGDVVYVD